MFYYWKICPQSFFSFNDGFNAFIVFYFIYGMYTRSYFLSFLTVNSLRIRVLVKVRRFPKKAQFHSSHKKHIVIFVLITKSDRRPTDVFGSERAPRDISVKQVCSHDVTAIDRSTNHKHIQQTIDPIGHYHQILYGLTLFTPSYPNTHTQTHTSNICYEGLQVSMKQ